MALRGCYILKKILVLSLCVILIAAFTFAACSKNSDDKTTTAKESTTAATSDLDSSDNEFGLEEETVTNKDGKAVTDSKGKAVTTDVAVVYKKDKKGNTYAQKLDNSGKEVTDKKGNPVTVKTETTKKSGKTTRANADTTGSAKTTAKETSSPKPTGTTKKGAGTTKSSDTTAFEGMEKVPKTSATGKEVNFSKEDQQIIANMLEVPYLYLESYENSSGVPIKIAAYTAIWMAQHDGGTASTYPSSPVVLNLFKFYGQTVVNFKTQVNKQGAPIKYNSKNDTFSVSKYPEKKQTVKITKIEDLGDNNFYKVTGKVSHADGIKEVQAVVQKNKLDSTLGFSIKALKWSK